MNIPFGLLTRSNQPAIPAYQPTQSAHPKPSTGSARLFTSQRISSLENFVFKLTLLLCLFAQFVQFFQEYGSPYDDLVALTHEKFMPTSFCYAQAWQIRPKKVKDLSEPVLRKRKAPHWITHGIHSSLVWPRFHRFVGQVVDPANQVATDGPPQSLLWEACNCILFCVGITTNFLFNLVRAIGIAQGVSWAVLSGCNWMLISVRPCSATVF